MAEALELLSNKDNGGDLSNENLLRLIGIDCGKEMMKELLEHEVLKSLARGPSIGNHLKGPFEHTDFSKQLLRMVA